MGLNDKRILLSPPHLTGEEMNYVKSAFDSNWIAPLGPHVEAFEEEIASYAGTNGALALSSGTAALHLALLLAGVKKEDTVFCSTLTFVASANPIYYLEAEPVFIDSEYESWNMSPKALEKAFEEASRIGKVPKAVVVTNLYGQSANMDMLLQLCNYYQAILIEDAAESLGATYHGCMSGSLGDYGIYSFNGNKIITTSGGGMLVSHNREALQKARFWSTQSREPVRHYEHLEIGYNYRLSNILASIGRAQFNKLEDRITTKRKIFENYKDALKYYPGLKFMPDAGYGRVTRWLTTLTVHPDECGKTRDELIDAMEAENIEARPVWKPMHRQPLFSKCRFYSHLSEPPSISDNIFEHGICLPSGTGMSEEEQLRVIQCLKKCLDK